jgi:hypothetical protein
VRRLAIGVLAVAVCLGTAAPTASGKPTNQRAVDRVLVVSVPRLTWKAVADARPPNLMALLRRSAVASMSLRTISARTTLGEGYATIGAGNRASVIDLTAGLGFDANERFESSPARDVYKRRVGDPGDARVLELGLAGALRWNRRLLYGAHIGELGSALARHQRRAAVIANADADRETSLVADGGYHREAVFGVMDRQGRVAGGTVNSALLERDPRAPYGRRLNHDRTLAAFETAWASNDVVLLELSDLERADAYGDVATSAMRRRLQAAALRRDDALLGRALAAIDPARTQVIVVSPAAPRVAEQLGVSAMAGPGVRPGLARSPTTRRAGYVTLPDVAPTILSALRLPIPHAMTGTVMTSNGGRAPDVLTARRFARDNARARFRDKATGPVSVVFVVFQVLVYGACAAALARRWRARATAAVAYLALVVLAMPLLGFLSGLVNYARLGVIGYTAALIAGAAVLAAAAWRLGRRRLLLAPGVLIGATLVMLLVDVIFGGRLQLNTVFGYSPIVAGRFSGYGNLAYGLLAMSAIVTATVAWAMLEGRRARGWAVGGVLVATLAVDGAPPWGSDVGGVLASGPAFVVMATLLSGRRIDWRRWAAAVGGTAALVAGFALVDLARPTSSRTHLGRLVAKPGDLGDVLHRKLLSNVHILTSSVWTLIIPVALAFLIFLALRPPNLLRSIQQRFPGLRACLVGGLLAGLLGFATNDSGVAVPAMMLAVLLPYLTYLLARTAHE